MDLFNSPVIPCCTGALVIALVFALIAFWRLLSYRETLALAEKGLVRPEKARQDGKDTLRWGILITALGSALCLGLYPLGYVFNMDVPFGFGPWMLLGLIPTFMGIGLVLIYVLSRNGRPEHYAPPDRDGENITSLEPPTEDKG